MHLCSDRDTALHFLGRTRRSLYYKTYLLANAHELAVLYVDVLSLSYN